MGRGRAHGGKAGRVDVIATLVKPDALVNHHMITKLSSIGEMPMTISHLPYTCVSASPLRCLPFNYILWR